jgi:hypothetical protein
MKTKNKNTTTTVIWIALVLASAAGLGYGIKQIRWTLAIRKNLSESKPEVQVVESEPEIEIVPEPEVEVVEIDTTSVEEPVWEEPEDEPQPEVAAEPQRQPWRMGQNSGAVQQFFDDLNLNEEEQARLREGFELMRRRFENMSNEDRMAEFAQMAETGERWQNMSDQEREGVTQRMRERYEVWRQSDSIEIPRLTLD